jgi:serine-type D-Ala-D-Ala carboxypeptidase
MGAQHGERVRPEEVGLVAEQLARADEAARRCLERGVGTAVTFAVSRHGVLAHVRCFGKQGHDGSEMATERSLFPIASVSKPVAATAIVLLMERGLFGLTTPVAELVPDFGRNGKRGVTVEHLLTHTSGLNEQFVDGFPYTTREAYYERLLNAPLMWAPGTYVAYSSAGFNALSEVIRHVTGKPAASFLAEELFAPLGMHDTFLSPPQEEHHRLVECRRPNGADMLPELIGGGGLAGAMFSTAADLVRFGNLFLAGGRMAEGAGLLSPTSVSAMMVDRTGHLPAAPGTPPGARRIGLGWMLPSPGLWACDFASPRAFGHQGSTGAYLVVDPTYDLVVARIGNRWGGTPAGVPEVMNAAMAAVG